MAEKLLNARFQQKTDTATNWNKAGGKGFIPKKGEIIVYQESDSNESKIKIGDEKTNINSLPFFSNNDGVGKTTNTTGSEIFNDYNNNSAVGMYAHAEGSSSKADGKGAHAEGVESVANGEGAHAEGAPSNNRGRESTKAFGKGAHAEGCGTQALTYGAHTEGDNTVVGSDAYNGHAEGANTYVSAYNAHAEGEWTQATAIRAHAEGYYTEADGNSSHAEGQYTKAAGNYSHAEGSNNHGGEPVNDDISNSYFTRKVTSDKKIAYTFANPYILEKYWTQYPEYKDLGETVSITIDGSTAYNSAHAEGAGTLAFGVGSHAEGNLTLARHGRAHAEGTRTVAFNARSHAEGHGTFAGGINSHAEGEKTEAFGLNSHSEGSQSKAIGEASHAEGGYDPDTQRGSEAKGFASHAEGSGTIAAVDQSHAEGKNTEAHGQASHAEGCDTKANGQYSHAEGHETEASGIASHAEGYNTKAQGDYSHSSGYNTIAIDQYQTVIGKFNEETKDSLFVIGNGRDGSPKNGLVFTTNDELIMYGIDYWQTKITGTSFDIFRTNEPGMVGIYMDNHSIKVVAGESGHRYTYIDGGYIQFRQYGDAKSISLDAENNQFYFSDPITLRGYFPVTIENINGQFHFNSSLFERGRYKPGQTTANNGEVFNNYSSNIATASFSHAEGDRSIAYGLGAHAEGGYDSDTQRGCIAEGFAAHAEGSGTIAKNHQSHAEGKNSEAIGWATHAEGLGTVATITGAHAQGKYNLIDDNKTYMHIVGFGSGSSSSARANIHTIDIYGNATFAGKVTGSGADYAEYFEWVDGNPNNEDRIGLIVALEQDKIRLANKDDEILGVVSGTAMVLGDNAEWEWKDKYICDTYGRPVIEMVEEFVDHYNKETETIEKISNGFYPHKKINPNYDPTKEYKNRSSRNEWEVIGLIGKLHVTDDGTCKVGKYAKVKENGIATMSEEKTNMKVMKRISDNVILVFMK